MSKAMNDGATAGKRTREGTTPTSIGEFAEVFARVYEGAAKAA